MMTPRTLIPALALLAIGSATAAFAQEAGPPAAEKVKQVIVYGEDPCPVSEGDEILVCARLPDNDRFRIPRELRTDPNDPKTQSWALRAQSIEYVGREGTQSCSPTGAGGFTGCFQQIAQQARAERRAMLGDATWAEAVAAAREKRLSGLDAESEEVEARVRAEEAQQQGTPAPGVTAPGNSSVP